MNTISTAHRVSLPSLAAVSPLHRVLAAASAAPVTLLLATVAIAVQAVPAWAAWLQFDRAAIAGGEIWRVFTGHLTHWSANHLLWDVLMFVLLGMLCERRSAARYYACLLLSAIGISAVLWWRMPTLELYRGLSGLDSALFALVAVLLLREAVGRRQHWWAATLAALLLGLVGKIGYEYATGTTLFVAADPQFVPLPLVHLVGGATGVLLALVGGCGSVRRAVDDVRT